MKRFKLLSLLLVFLLAFSIMNSYASSNDRMKVLYNDAADNIPTFGSFNQHMAEINGVYYASYSEHLKVHIVKSTDGGSTWTDLYANGYSADQPAVIASDNSGRLHVIWADQGIGRYMRFSGNPLVKDIDTTVGSCGTKFSMVYSPVHDVLYWSRRENGDNYIVKLNTSGQVLSSTKIMNHVGTWGVTEYWDGHYHSMYVDANGRLHLIYSPHWFSADTTSYIRKKVLYMYSDDQGATWKKANGSTIAIPFNVNDFVNGGTVISTEPDAIGMSLLANNKNIHILYQSNSITNGIKYVRLNRSTGSEEKRTILQNLSMHTTIIEDRTTNKLYLMGESGNNRPTLQVSDNWGDTWSVFSQIVNEPFTNGYYFSTTSYPRITSDGSAIGITTNYETSGTKRQEVQFIKFKVKENTSKNYRFENTTSGTTAVSDGASLRLDGTYQIKDYSGVPMHGNPVSLNGTSFGTYESADGTVTPVPYAHIRDASFNNFFAKLSYANKERIEVGDFDVGSGLTIEGWFYPTGNQADAFYNSRLVTKRTGWGPGNFWSNFNSDGSVSFGVYDPQNYRVWTSSANQIRWNQWNYVAITWTKDSKDVSFYIKHLDDSLYSEVKTNNDLVSGFPNTSDIVTIGYNANFDLGYEGYMDDIYLSSYTKAQSELMVNDLSNYYRLEATASGTTAVSDGASLGLDGKFQIKNQNNYTKHGNPLAIDGVYSRFEKTASEATQVYDGASLRLDGTNQIKDESNLRKYGNPVSYNGTNFGTYESADGSVTPVPYNQIKGISYNNFFIKLNYANKERIEMGDYDVGSGLTIEGWFYPTGNQADAYYNARLVTKRTGWGPGNFWSNFNSDGSVSFGVYDPQNYRVWISSANVIRWNQWNYVAITWKKDSKDVNFYVKHLDDSLFSETKSNNDLVAGFPDTNDIVTIGYNANFDCGYQGYMDEVRISDFKANQEQLLVNNSTCFGTYESSYGSVSPVSYTLIRGAASNNYFGRLNPVNKQFVELGDIDAADGLTLEGWFYPMGSQSDVANSGRLIGKLGSYGLDLTTNAGVKFYIFDNDSTKKEWVGTNNRIAWNQWNYIAITWQKNSNTVNFYIKQPGGSLFQETITNMAVQAAFDTGNSPVCIGSSLDTAAIPQRGFFEGCFDEVRITGTKLSQGQLLIQ